MKLLTMIIGAMMVLGSYFWYQYAFLNQDVFKYIMFGSSAFFGETTLPLILGVMGFIIFIAGVFKD